MPNLIVIRYFQTASLPEDFLKTIFLLSKNASKTVFFIRTSPVRVTKRNPLDFESRKKMLENYFAGHEIYELPDRPSAKSWSEEIDRLARRIFPSGEIELCGGRELVHEYEGVLKISRTHLPEIAEEKQIVLATEDFRAGAVYAAQYRYPSVFPTVDVAIFKDGKLLLGRKPHQEKFRFIGGFADPADANFEVSAKREAEEETGLKVGKLKYLGSAQIDDWRYRNEADKIITSFFAAEVISGEAKANDDIEELRWFEMGELTEELLVEEHRVLFRFLIAAATK